MKNTIPEDDISEMNQFLGRSKIGDSYPGNVQQESCI